MNQANTSIVPQILQEHESELLSAWLGELSASGSRAAPGREGEMREQCAEFLRLLRAAVQGGITPTAQGPQWTEVRETLARLSRARAVQGFTPRETALFVFSFKKPLFSCVRAAIPADADALAREVETAGGMLDELGLWTTEVFQKAREEVIARQQAELMELSTPVVRLWDGILAVPLIGTLDSARTQTVMEALLQAIVSESAEIAIIDITGVPTVDTLTAQHLLKTVTAARLMGAECIISGIRPQIAQTIVHLGVELGEVITKATLADAFTLALRRAGVSISRAAGRS